MYESYLSKKKKLLKYDRYCYARKKNIFLKRRKIIYVFQIMLKYI